MREQHAKIPLFQKKESKGNKRKTVRESIKGKGKELGSDEKRKVAGKEKEGNRDKEKIHKADMVNRKNTEVQGKCEVAKTGG